MADEDIRKELEETKRKLEEIQARGAKGIWFKVSEKRALSVYGIGRFPVTLYREQWEKLLSLSEDIRAFINENSEQLKTKAEKDKEAK